MQVNGSVISVNLNTKIAKNGGGQYDGWELVYRSPENEVKQLAKPVQSLKFNAGLKAGLESLKNGDQFVADMEKNANGFWDVKSVKFDDGSAVANPEPAKDSRSVSSASVVSGGSSPRGGKVSGSTYETPEERAKKQVVIVRQTSIDYSLKFAESFLPGEGMTLEKILENAEIIEKHVHKSLKAAAKKYLEVKLTEEE